MDDYDGAAEALADMTGRPQEEFEPDLEENPIPEYGEQDYEKLEADGGQCGDGMERETEKIILVVGLEDGPAGLTETPRRAFDDKDEAYEFLEYEAYGGRVIPIELERTQNTDTDLDAQTNGGQCVDGTERNEIHRVEDRKGVRKNMSGWPTGLNESRIPTGERDLDYHCPSCGDVGFVDHPNRVSKPLCTNTDCRVNRFSPFVDDISDTYLDAQTDGGQDVPMVVSRDRASTTVYGTEPGPYQAWERAREEDR